MENCGKIIEKKCVLNLALSGGRGLIQDYESAKKVSPFLILTFKHYFSLILEQLFEANLLTLSVVNRLWITFALVLVFKYQHIILAVDNLFIV